MIIILFWHIALILILKYYYCCIMSGENASRLCQGKQSDQDTKRKARCNYATIAGFYNRKLLSSDENRCGCYTTRWNRVTSDTRRIIVAWGRLPRTVTRWWKNVALSAQWLRVENSSPGRRFYMHSSLKRATNMSYMQCRRGGVRAVGKWKISSRPGLNYGPAARNYQANGLDELFFPGLNLITPPPPWRGVSRR